MEATLNWLSEPATFAVNRQLAHSDHKFFLSQTEQENPSGSFCSLAGEWYFSYADKPAERITDFYKMEYDVSHFDKITVPGHIQLAGYDNCQYINTVYPWDGREEMRPPQVSTEYNPVGSYVTFFDVPEQMQGKRTFVSFQGVETAFYVWLNGTFIGYSEDSFTPSEFELTEVLQEKGNKLAVEVYKRSSASWIEDQDFWRFSGIFRDVYLYAIPEVHVRDLFVHADLVNDYQDGQLQIEAELIGAVDELGHATVRLFDKAGREVFGSKEAAVEDGKLVLIAEVPSVDAWSAEAPALYDLEIELHDTAGNRIELVTQKVGFRTFEMINNIMCLNGKRIVFKGVNRHEFNCRLGRAITEADMLWDIRFLKQNNINAVRTSHYPNQTRWYELCDEYGIYLIDEANLESHGSWQKMGACEPSWNVPGSLPEWKACVVDRAISMLERDKNHPSVLIWSCGNESYAGEDIMEMTRYFHERDKSRLVHYEGVFWNREFDAISDMESRMYAKPKEIEAYLQGEHHKPYISCEYMHAMGNSCGGMHLYTDLEAKYADYQGGFIWDYIDQAVMKTEEDGREHLVYGGDFDDRATDYCFCTDGIIYADRTPSPKMPEVKQLYANVKLTVNNENKSHPVVVIENQNLFIDTADYDFVFRVMKEGICCEEQVKKLVVKPSETMTVPFALTIPTEQGEYVLEVLMQQAIDTLWAKAGHEMTFAQSVVKVGEIKQTDLGGKKLTVVHGDVNIGVRGEGFEALFSKGEGGIISLIYDGTEYLTRTPKVSFWRATTDNDRGMGNQYTMAQWLAASMGARQQNQSFKLKEDEQQVRLDFVFEAPSQPSFVYQVSYLVCADGSVSVSISYPGVAQISEMPLFGIDFKMKKEYSHFSYYGYGPEENYIDRCQGARLGVFESDATQNMARYLIPQECGNRIGIRYLTVDNGQGKGLRFTAVAQTFEGSVLPYSAYELEQAFHIEELPPVNYTWVRILAAQMGVGGDDSWGAPIHPQYQIAANEPRELTFVISKL